MDNKPQPWQLQPHCWARRQVVELSGLPVQGPAKEIPNAALSCRLAALGRWATGSGNLTRKRKRLLSWSETWLLQGATSFLLYLPIFSADLTILLFCVLEKLVAFGLMGTVFIDLFKKCSSRTLFPIVYNWLTQPVLPGAVPCQTMDSITESLCLPGRLEFMEILSLKKLVQWRLGSAIWWKLLLMIRVLDGVKHPRTEANPGTARECITSLMCTHRSLMRTPP